MKLKRILSLALAGVMAAGMLAGCSGGNSTGISTTKKSSTVQKAMQEAVTTGVTYETDNELYAGIKAVAETLTAYEVEGATKTGKIISGDPARNTVGAQLSRYVSGIDTWTSSFGKWSGSGTSSATYASVLLFDGEMTAEQVGAAMATNVNVWTPAEGYSFDGHVAACLATIKTEGADGKVETQHVWVVGLLLDVEAPAADSTT